MQMNFEMPAEFETELQNSVSKVVAEVLSGTDLSKQVPEYMGKGEVCKYLNISRNTLDTWIRKGQAPRYTLIGGTYRFKRSEIDKFMLDHSK